MYTPEQVAKLDPNQVKDLRAVFLTIFDSAITADVPDIAVSTGLKRNYVNELVQLLSQIPADSTDVETGLPLVTINMKAGEKLNGEPIPLDLWQATFTMDDESREEAEQRIDRALAPVKIPPAATAAVTKPATPPRSAPATKDNPAGLPLCLCGCDQPLNNRKRNYKPGHDARHAGQVARAVAAGELGDKDVDVWLPTDALRVKARDMVVRLRTKANAKPPIAGQVTTGKGIYPARKSATGQIDVNSRKDGKGQWKQASVKVAATFEAVK